MWSDQQRGFSLIEMVLAIVIIGVGLAGVLLAFQLSVRGSADPLVQRQLQAIAEGMMEEVLSKPYSAIPGSGSGGCARDGFNDIDDYLGYAQPICEINGSLVAALSGYRVLVTVQPSTLAGVTAKRISVTALRGSLRLNLVAWRTDYGS